MAPLPTPHGGRLVNRLVTPAERVRREAEKRDLATVRPFVDQLYDAEKIGIGAYSPLDGFQGSAELESILKAGRLTDGLPWSIPIIFAPTDSDSSVPIADLRQGDDIALLDTLGSIFAMLHIEEKFHYDRKKLAQSVYSTVDPAHPNVPDMLRAGDLALAGRLSLMKRLSLPTGALELTPEETRAEFARRGWSNVAAYQTRNVPHTAHEYLQRCTLEREDVDGLFVHPVLGRLKKGDYRPEVIVEAYQTLLRHYYPSDRVVLASLSITMRYGGPKAALFLAIIRKNFGCRLYIVGRDQAGVGNFYEPYACQRIFDEYPIDVVPLKFAETFFCRSCGWMATSKTCAHPASEHLDTSQTRIRAALSGGQALPRELIRPEIAAILTRSNALISG